NSRDPDDSVMQAAETAIREVVGKSKMDFVLYEGREQVAANAQTLMQAILDRHKAGITISKVTMRQAQPPEQVQAAFDDAVKAGQDRERQKNEGQAYANDVVPRAPGMASGGVQGAEGYRAGVGPKPGGESSSNVGVPRARGMASRVVQEAEGSRASVVPKAEGDASRFKQIL